MRDKSAVKDSVAQDNIKIEPNLSEMQDSTATSNAKKKKPQEHFSDLQVSNIVQARLWCTYMLGWHMISTVVRLIFALS